MNSHFHSIPLFSTYGIPASDYMILLHDFQKTINSDIIDISNEYPEKKYPIGLLAGKIRLFFVHYKSFQEAVDAWRRRSKRINYGNLRIVFVERDGATYEHLKEFDSLSFEHKVALTHKQYPDIKCAFSLKGCTKDDQIDMPYRYSGWFGKKFFDQFDWALFFCGKYKCA